MPSKQVEDILVFTRQHHAGHGHLYKRLSKYREIYHSYYEAI